MSSSGLTRCEMKYSRFPCRTGVFSIGVSPRIEPRNGNRLVGQGDLESASRLWVKSLFELSVRRALPAGDQNRSKCQTTVVSSAKHRLTCNA